MIDGMIENFNSNPNTSAAQIIEINRISTLYWNIKHSGQDTEMKIAIDSLSVDEKMMLDENTTVWWE